MCVFSSIYVHQRTLGEDRSRNSGYKGVGTERRIGRKLFTVYTSIFKMYLYSIYFKIIFKTSQTIDLCEVSSESPPWPCLPPQSQP